MAMQPAYTVWHKPGRSPVKVGTYTSSIDATQKAMELLSDLQWVKIELGLARVELTPLPEGEVHMELELDPSPVEPVKHGKK